MGHATLSRCVAMELMIPEKNVMMAIHSLEMGATMPVNLKFAATERLMHKNNVMMAVL